MSLPLQDKSIISVSDLLIDFSSLLIMMNRIPMVILVVLNVGHVLQSESSPKSVADFDSNFQGFG